MGRVTLKDVPVGRVAVIDSYSSTLIDRTKLLDMGLTPGCEVVLKRNMAWSNMIQLTLRQTTIMIRSSLASHINVRVVS